MNIFTESYKVPELRKKMWFTFLVITAIAVLSLVPVPGLDHAAAEAAVRARGDIGRIMNVMSLGSYYNVSVTSLGLFPFLIASIIMQILAIAVPKLREIAMTGEDGAKTMERFTQIAALISDVVFGILYCVGMRNHISGNINFWLGIVLCAITVAIGAAFWGWGVDFINKKGIGSGLTVIILTCVIRETPRVIFRLCKGAESLGLPVAVAIAAGAAVIALAVFVFVVFVNLGDKKLRIIFSKRTVGMKQYAMQNQVLPLKITQAGIMPVVYSLTIMLLIPVIISLVLPEGFANPLTLSFTDFTKALWFYLLFLLFIPFFTYVFSTIQFNPMEMSNQIKQYGGYIQGVRPGKPTAQYLMSTYQNLNVADSGFLVLICMIPLFLAFIPAIGAIRFGGIIIAVLGGGFIELRTVLENALKTEEEKNKMAGKNKRKNKYGK